jgi:hypothetical protein
MRGVLNILAFKYVRYIYIYIYIGPKKKKERLQSPNFA